ncbi:Retrovirus-related Pol polyprotein from transposon TNT 1-94 [Senna tora]|uniref:Retrovirus-related Pol polyprotein from transposon TNT 1-94 n=1 Tax=Senna tora TaxID=362788 RepID=A0A834XJ87_9FABA|nr:Retrovirus-related Pol polyprotein from transposon TNT 1-94 [Senna tora]
MIVLGCLHLDHAFRLERPAALTDTSTNVERTAHEKWERSNRMCLMIMQHSIQGSLRGGILENTDAKEEERHKQNKVESALIASSSGVKASKKRKRNDKGTTNNGESSKNAQKKQYTGRTCFFCRKHGHVKKDCPKFAD